MKKVKLEIEEYLQAEFDLKIVQLRRLGSRRTNFGGSTVRLERSKAYLLDTEFF